MQYEANSPEDYISQVPEERRATLEKLRAVINKNLPRVINILYKESFE